MGSERVNTDRPPAKYGSRGETTLRLTKPIRDRLLVVAAHERLKMNEWIEVRIIEREEAYGIVPPED